MVRNNEEQSYRARALKLFPWVCAHCGREFDGKKLSQLTVHHKDHNHDNNPRTAATGSCSVSTATTTSINAIR